MPDAPSERLGYRPIGLLGVIVPSRKQACVVAELALFVVVSLFGLDTPIRPVGQGHADADDGTGVLVVKIDPLRHFAAKDCQQNTASGLTDRFPVFVSCRFKVFLASRRLDNDFSLASQKPFPDEIVVVLGSAAVSKVSMTTAAVVGLLVPTRDALVEEGIRRKKDQAATLGDTIEDRCNRVTEFGQEVWIVVIVAVGHGELFSSGEMSDANGEELFL